ncbi:MogA/MoaB family molybdenum cofactor biosynthesis protein [Alkalihalobacillus pseudalcaliphilus]|uniref:MogA/MoaB family molybdenum cofactor biosynthesis protein n=1 Tax=Alkalihalobacillus pseudalcaliphilus TaxID=79884 RepID=UPI00064E0E6D|nr:MogA/MoaB family molybdenum cofactor biosynthesis protein [Alkalihalobacillus pseudalcaliphilus]KMK74680.1 molybdenum cofactor biosynthesis protein B [Alkalihalobacillus pseudalcaliphilus]
MSVSEHKAAAKQAIRCTVITVSDTRTEETDSGGALLMQMLKDAGHIVEHYFIIQDETLMIQEKIKTIASLKSSDAILLTGGTGIAKRDHTYEAVQVLLNKEMTGFGELFRYLSFVEDIGSAAILSRAVAGVYQDTAVFSMPGSRGAIRLAMQRLILPELGHVVREIKKDL